MARVLRSDDYDLLAQARQCIRDLVHGYAVKDLCEDPREVCARLTDLIGDGDEFEFDGAESG